MIGSHELLLIVRAQNQAGAAIGRVSRDIRNLQRQRDLAGRQASLTNRAAAQSLRLAQMEGAEGTRRIALEQSRLRINHQIEAVTDRTAGLELRRAGIVARANQLFRQEERIKAQILGLDDKDYAATTRILQAQQRMVRTQEAIAGLRKGRVDISTGQFTQEPGMARSQAVLRAQRAQTSAMQAQLQRDLAAQRAAMARSGGGDATVANQRAAIAERRFAEATEGARIAKQAVKELNVVEQDLRRTEEIQLRQVNELRAARSNLAREEAQLRAQLAGTQDAWAQLSARERQVQASESQHIRLLEDLQMRLRAVGAQELELAQQAKIAAGQLELTNAQLAEVNAQMNRTNMERFTTGARAVTHFGRVMQMTGLITTAALGAMAIAAGHFVQESTLAATQSGMTFTQIQRNSTQVQQAVLKEMQQFPGASQDVTKSFYDILSSMDVNTQGANRMMVAFQKTAVAGMAPLNDVVNAGITILNNFGKAAGTPDQAMNQLLATVRFGRLNVEQYTTSMNQLVPAFTNAGQSLLQMNSAFAELTRLMPSQRMAATSLARLMELFGRPNFAQGAKQFGIIMRDSTGAMLPFNRIIRQFGTSMNPMIVKLREGRVNAQSFFKQISGTQGTVQAQRAFTELIRHSDELDKRMRQIHGDSYELTRSFNAMRRTPGVEWQVFVNTLKAAAIEIGFSVIPAFRRMGQFITPIVRGFNNLSPHTKRLIGDFAAFTAVGLLVGGTLLAVMGSLTLMIVSLRTIGPYITKFTGGFAAASEEAGLARVGLLRFMGGLGLFIMAMPIAAKVTGSLTHAIIDLVAAYAAWRVAAMIGMANPLVAIGIAVVTVTKLMADGIQHFQQQAIDAQRRVASNHDIHRMGQALGHEVALMVNNGRSFAEILTIMHKRLGDSDNAAMVLASALRQGRIEAEKIASQTYLSNRMLPKPGRPPEPVSRAIPTTGPLTTQQALERLRQLNEMRDRAETAPSIANWQRYYAALKGFQKQITQDQQETLDQVGTLTDRRVMEMARNVNVLRTRWEKSPTLANWRAYWQAQTAMADQATAKQQQMVQDQGTLTDSQVLQMSRTVQRLRSAWERNPSLANWKAYYQAQQDLATQATARQQQMAQDTQVLSDQDVLRMTRNVARLRAAWEKNPNIANWKAYYQAQQALSEQASQSQQQMAQDVGTLTDAQVIRMTINAARLRAVFEKAPNTRNWRAWKAAMDAITTSATQDQQAMATDVQKISDAQVMHQVRNLNKLARIAAHSHRFSDIKAYNVALQQMQDAATSIQMSTAQNFLISIDSVMKKAKKKIKDHSKETINAARQAINQIAGTLSSTYDQMQQQNQQAFGTLFQGPVVQGPRMQFNMQYGYKPTGRDYLRDLRAMLSRFRQWQRVLGQLRRRGAPFEMIQQIQAMGPDALPEARALLGMQPRQFDQYVRVFRTSQRVIAQASRRDMNSTLRHWRSLGNNIMKAIMQGMDEHTAEFANYFRNLAIKLFPRLAHTGRVRPRRAIDPVVPAGEPRNRAHSRPRTRVAPQPAHHAPRGATVGGRHLATAGAPTHYHYHASSGMDYSTWLRKSRSHMRNRH
jgi:TP901 family phage tail tape measure protein